MIIQEIKNINGRDFKLTYSDNNKKIRQIETGEIYIDALDTLNSNYSYEETNEIAIKEQESFLPKETLE